MFLASFSTYTEHSVNGNPFPPFSMMLLTVANRLTKNEFLFQLDLWANIFNEEPVRLEMVWNFYYLMTICGY